MRRGPVALTVVLVLIFSSAAFAQNDADLKKRVFEAYDALDGVILPPELNRNVAANGIDLSRDNLGEVKKFLESTPDAPLICAALFAGGFGTRSISGVHQLRFAELDLCMSHRPTQEQSEKVRPWVLPPPPSRRESIASTFVPHDFSRFVDGGYSPPLQRFGQQLTLGYDRFPHEAMGEGIIDRRPLPHHRPAKRHLPAIRLVQGLPLLVGQPALPFRSQ